MLSDINSNVEALGRIVLLVQLQPRLLEVEQEFTMTADKGIECLVLIKFLKTNKSVLNLHEENLYSTQFIQHSFYTFS